MPSALASPQIELVQLIAEALDSANDWTNTFLSLRSTCREIRDKLSRLFSRTYFTFRHPWLGAQKLAELTALSENAAFAAQVEGLDVICPPGVVVTRRDIDATMPALAVALGRSPNLKAVDFVDMTPEAVHEQVDEQRGIQHEFVHATLLAEAVLHSIASSGQQLGEIATFARPGRVGRVGFSLPERLLPLIGCFAALQTLEIDLFEDRYTHDVPPEWVDLTWGDLRNNVETVQPLEEVKLHLAFADEVRDFFSHMADLTTLPGLQRSSLGQAKVNMDILDRFLFRHATTLELLKLDDTL